MAKYSKVWYYMIYNAKSGQIILDDTTMDYVSFGYGNKILIVIPGLSDGLTTVKGKSLFLLKPYRKYLNDYKVYIFSRKNKMPNNYSIKDMANDQIIAMKKLGIKKANILGVSQGGMIAQTMAINNPELINKLIIAVSSPKTNDLIIKNINEWLNFVKINDHKKLMISFAENYYTENFLKKYRLIYPIIGMIGKPKNYNRFIINAKAIKEFDIYDEIDKIKSPTYILAGENDKIVGIQASYDMYDKIKNSKLYIYNNMGHAPNEEDKQFYDKVFNYLSSN